MYISIKFHAPLLTQLKNSYLVEIIKIYYLNLKKSIKLFFNCQTYFLIKFENIE